MAPYFFVYNCWKRHIYLSCCYFWLFKHQPWLFSYFQTSKYVRRHLVCWFLASKYIICASFASAAPIMFHFNPGNAKYLHYTLSISWQGPKMKLLPFVSSFTSENITGTFFVFLESLSMDSLPFSSILTWKYINHSYLLAIFLWSVLQIHQEDLISLFIIVKNVTFTFPAVFCLQNVNCAFFVIGNI